MDKSPTPERPDYVTPSRPQQGVDTPRSPTDGEGGAPTAAPPPPLTPMAWLTNNGVYLLMMMTVVVLIYRAYGLDGLWRALLVAVGLGFVIFIHELGHFLAAKWCDVHVQTFSIGFGPALPGCSFQSGETLYKIAILPLGGYVNMVGEGTDVEENEDYPRSFKNKTVLQRMLIISAGVIMNVILGAILLVIVYMAHGVDHPPAIVGQLESGGPAWKAGVRSGADITRIEGINNPTFDDLRIKVALSYANRRLLFTMVMPNGETETLSIEPRRDRNDRFPVIGVAPPSRLKLPSAEGKKNHELPVSYASPAASARVFDLKPGDVVVKVVNAVKGEELAPLPTKNWVAELCRRMQERGQEPLGLEVRRRDGKTERIEVAAGGFQFGDNIVGTTDPETPDQPFNVKALPPDPTRTRDKEDKDDARDPFAFRKRLRQLAGKPMVLQVIRAKDETNTPVNILVPPAYHYSLGVSMKMGEVAAIRDKSPAAVADVRPATDTVKGDELKKIAVDLGDGIKEIPMDDPTRVPFELAQTIRGRKNKDKPVQVIVTVLRPNPNNHKALDDKILKMDWDDSWDYQEEAPLGFSAPMAIPQLGIAYRVQTTVTKVKEDSPAARAGILPDDVFEKISLAYAGPTGTEVKWPSRPFELKSKRGAKDDVFDRWPRVFYELQHSEVFDVKVYVRRGDKLLEKPIEMTAVLDTTWPLETRGLLLQYDLRLQKADSVTQALQFGFDDTVSFIKQMYLNLASLFSGRISMDSLGGPLRLAETTFAAAQDPYLLLRWLGMISLNLAVVNFLPIPILDGGHMVFLIYEALRRRRPSETVQAVATYAGLAVILSLMVFVFYNDIKEIWPWLMPW